MAGKLRAEARWPFHQAVHWVCCIICTASSTSSTNISTMHWEFCWILFIDFFNVLDFLANLHQFLHCNDFTARHAIKHILLMKGVLFFQNSHVLNFELSFRLFLHLPPLPTSKLFVNIPFLWVFFLVFSLSSLQSFKSSLSSLEFLRPKKEDQVVRIEARGGGVRWFGQCPKENKLFFWCLPVVTVVVLHQSLTVFGVSFSCC